MNIKIASVAAASLFAAIPVTAEELRLTHFMSPMHHMQKNVMEPLGQQLSEETGGALTVRIFPAGELSKSPPAQWRSALTGVSDIAFGLPGYTTEEFPRVMLTMSPALFETAEQGTNALWDNIDSFAPDFERAKLLALWSSDPVVLMTSKVPVDSIDDLKGLRIRSPDTVAATLLANWGAVPVPLPASEIYQSLDTGVIDGLLIDPSGVPSFKLNEVVKHVTLGLPTPSSPFFMVMNQRRYDALSEAERNAVDARSGRELSLASATSYAGEADHGMQILRDASIDIITLTDEARAEFMPGAEQVTQGLAEVATQAGVENAGDIVAKLSSGK